MSAVDLHAIVLLAIPVITGAMCLLSHRRPYKRDAWFATFIAVAALLVLQGATSHLCRSGNPATQLLIGCAFVWFALVFVKSLAVRIVFTAVILVVTAALSQQYVVLVHQRHWTGNVTSLVVADHMATKRLEAVEDELRDVGKVDEQDYPEGWLCDLPIADALDNGKNVGRPFRFESHRLWHTAVTRLWRVDVIHRDFWYPGGPMASAADRMTLRDRKEVARVAEDSR